MTTPPIVMTCGEPAGIGPELAVKAWEALGGQIPFVWLGDHRHLPKGAPFTRVNALADIRVEEASSLPVLQHDFPEENKPGEPVPANAQSVIDVLERAVSLVSSGQASALTTAPISKQILIDSAGFAYPGHTEFLAAQAGVETVVMMLASPALRVVPATIHIPLSEVRDALTSDLLTQTIQITAQALQTHFGIAHPRLAVAGLNPHAGEGGKLGTEEQDWIADLIMRLPTDTMTVTGPHPADTMFHAAARAQYDAAIAMYHDQALIPIKTLDFDRGVNVTLGLPFIRTSPDHGTAFDIAGTGRANPSSTIEALKLAWRMVNANTSEPVPG